MSQLEVLRGQVVSLTAQLEALLTEASRPRRIDITTVGSGAGRILVNGVVRATSGLDGLNISTTEMAGSGVAVTFNGEPV